jgi:hypothetical protein
MVAHLLVACAHHDTPSRGAEVALAVACDEERRFPLDEAGERICAARAARWWV